LQAFPLAGVAVWTVNRAQGLALSAPATDLLQSIDQALPQVDIDPALLGWHVLGYAFLASPANHIVRCFVGKSPEGQLAYLVQARPAARGPQIVEPEIAAA